MNCKNKTAVLQNIKSKNKVDLFSQNYNDFNAICLTANFSRCTKSLQLKFTKASASTSKFPKTMFCMRNRQNFEKVFSDNHSLQWDVNWCKWNKSWITLWTNHLDEFWELVYRLTEKLHRSDAPWKDFKSYIKLFKTYMEEK